MLDALKSVIKHYRGKKNFFRLIARNFGYDTPEYRLIHLAYMTARRDFFKKRRLDGDRYFYHLVAVAVILLAYLGVKDANVIAAGLLHDSIEDIDEWTEAAIAQDFNSDVGQYVEAVTKPDPEPFGTDLHAFEVATFAKVRNGGFRCILIKLADRTHNMITLWGSPEKKRAKTLETLRYVLPLAVEVDTLWQELTVASAEQLNQNKECFFQ